MAEDKSKPLKYKTKGPVEHQEYKSYNVRDPADRMELSTRLSVRAQKERDMSKSERTRRTLATGSIRAPSVQAQTREFGESVKVKTVRALQSPGSVEVRAEVDDHLLELSQLSKRYGTQINEEDPALSTGLTAAAAADILAKQGENRLTPPVAPNKILQFIKLMGDPFIVMLLAAGVLSLCTQIFSKGDLTPTYLGVVLILVVLANVAVDFIQLQKSARVLAGFGNLAPPRCTVVRDGVASTLDASQLVLGDLVKATAGDKLPADLRLVHCTAMKVDNSSLTGEAEPQGRRPFTDHREVLEADNLAFFGTTVVNGFGFGIVIRTGDRTVMGKIAQLAGTPDHKVSPLTQEIKMFVKLMAITALATAIVIFAAGMGINGNFVTNLLNFVGVFVAFVPQGLPATVTMLLTCAAQALAARHVLVKDLRAVDTLGTITMLASDKTGTLTQNRMTVVRIWQGLKMFMTRESMAATGPSAAVPSATGGGSGDGKSNRSVDLEVFDTVADNPLVRCISLCNAADFERSEENMAKPIATREVMGDATETGLLRMVAAALDIDALRKTFPSALDVPFNSREKYALSIRRTPHANGSFTLYLKGAPERVLRRCTTVLVDGEEKDISAESAAVEFQKQFISAYEALAGEGQRVIACAMLELDGATFDPAFMFDADAANFPMQGLTFVGLTGLQDPPKVGVKEAIAACRSAQIQVMMVTGDHPLTAGAIAKQVGIITGRTVEDAAKQLNCSVNLVPEEAIDAVVIHGEKIPSMTAEDWNRTLKKKEIVFARTSPEQKLEIVLRAQGYGHVVGVTGDGVNDSPALRRSDLGIAMAITGSDVSREAAAIVLLDDNFASVVNGIEEGRKIFCNLKKAIQFTLGHILAELMPFIFFIILGLPLGLSSFLILFIDLGTELGPALSFAFEPAEDNIMRLRPRRYVAAHDVVVSAEEVAHIEELNLAVERDEMEVETHQTATARRSLATKLGRSAKMRCKDMCSMEGLKPAHPNDEILVDRRLVYWSYGQNGLIEVAWSLVTYFALFNYKGIPPSELLGLSTNYFPSQNDSKNYMYGGQTWTPKQQDHLLAQVQSAVFFTIVIMQFFAAFMLKVLQKYPCHPSFFQNKYTFYGIAFGTALAFLVTCTPGIRTVLGSSPFPFWTLAISVAGGIFHLVFEIFRRAFVFRRAAAREAEAAAKAAQEEKEREAAIAQAVPRGEAAA